MRITEILAILGKILLLIFILWICYIAGLIKYVFYLFIVVVIFGFIWFVCMLLAEAIGKRKLSGKTDVSTFFLVKMITSISNFVFKKRILRKLSQLNNINGNVPEDTYGVHSVKYSGPFSTEELCREVITFKEGYKEIKRSIRSDKKSENPFTRYHAGKVKVFFGLKMMKKQIIQVFLYKDHYSGLKYEEKTDGHTGIEKINNKYYIRTYRYYTYESWD